MNDILTQQRLFVASFMKLNKTLTNIEKNSFKETTARALNSNLLNLSNEMKKNFKVIKDYKADKSPIFNAMRSNLATKSDRVKQSITYANIFRKLLGVEEGSGSILDSIAAGLERRAEIKREKKEFRKDYAKFNKAGYEDSQNLSRSDFNKNADELFESIKKKEYELAVANADVLRGLESAFGRARDIDLDRQARLEHELELLKSSGYGDSISEQDNTTHLQKQTRHLQDVSKPAEHKEISADLQRELNSRKEIEEILDRVESKKNGHDLSEKEIESQRQLEKQTETLEKIELNTRDKSNSNKSGLDLGGLGKFGALGGLFGGLFGGLGKLLGPIFKGISSALMTGLLTIFKPANILRLLGRFFLPALIIGGLVNGIIDGFNEWKKTGSIKEALIAALGGFVEVISLGFFGKEDVERAIEYWKPYVMEAFDWLVKPFVEGFKLLSMGVEFLFAPIQTAFNVLKGWADSLLGWAKEKFPSFFADDPAKSHPTGSREVSGKIKPAQTNVPEGVLKQKTEEARKGSTPKTPAGAIINAPTTNINKPTTNIINRNPVRNQETSINKYFDKRSSFA